MVTTRKECWYLGRYDPENIFSKSAFLRRTCTMEVFQRKKKIDSLEKVSDVTQVVLLR